MNSRSTGQLGQTADSILHFSRSHHHKVCQLVNDNDNLGHLYRLFVILYILYLFNSFIVAL